VLAIQRFVKLVRASLPEMKLTSRLSDAFPCPPAPTIVEVSPDFAGRYVGRPVTADQIRDILTPLEFAVRSVGDRLSVTVPTFRATKDITIEAT
jgi:phenylalanyl-tRNA synthetase beta chain